MPDDKQAKPVDPKTLAIEAFKMTLGSTNMTAMGPHVHEPLAPPWPGFKWVTFTDSPGRGSKSVVHIEICKLCGALYAVPAED